MEIRLEILQGNITKVMKEGKYDETTAVRQDQVDLVTKFNCKKKLKDHILYFKSSSVNT